MKKCIFILLFPVLLFAQNTNTMLYYYATWNYGEASGIKCPPESLSFAGKKVKYVIHSDNANVSQTPPYVTYMLSDSLTSTALGSRNELFYALNSNGGNGDTTLPAHRWQRRFITAVHDSSAKGCLMISAVNAANLNYVAVDSARTELFTTTFCMFAKRFGYDGVELDWEGWNGTGFPDGDNIADTLNRFVRILHRKMISTWGATTPRPPLFISCGSTQYDTYWASQDTCLTAYIMQMYDFDQNYGGSQCTGYPWNAVWHISPLYCGDRPAGSEMRGWNTSGAGQWLSAGHSLSRISALLPTYGTLYRGQNTIGTCFSSSQTSYSYVNCLDFANYGGVFRRDLSRGMCPYINGNISESLEGMTTGEAFWVTFEDSTSYHYKVRWLDSVGVSLVGFYDITGTYNADGNYSEDMTPAVRWLRAAIEGLGGSTPPVEPPVTPPTVTTGKRFILVR
jgi:hypothetical protein